MKRWLSIELHKKQKGRKKGMLPLKGCVCVPVCVCECVRVSVCMVGDSCEFC